MTAVAYVVALVAVVCMVVFVMATPRIEAWMMRGVDGDL